MLENKVFHCSTFGRWDYFDPGLLQLRDRHQRLKPVTSQIQQGLAARLGALLHLLPNHDQAPSRMLQTQFLQR
jgi:hypothetical protein